MPSPALGGIGCLLQSRAGPRAEVTFLRSFGGDGFQAGIEGAASAAWPDSRKRLLIFRLASSMLPWRPLPGVTGLTRIATLGHLHFTPIRPRQVRALTLLSGSWACPERTAAPSCSCRRQGTGPIGHCRSVITRRGKKTAGSAHRDPPFCAAR